MKPLRSIQTATLVLLVGLIAPAYAQRDQQEDKQNKGEERGQPEKQARPERPPDRSQHQQRAEPSGQQRRETPAQPRQEQPAQRQQAPPQPEQRAQQPQEQRAQRPQAQPNLPAPQQRQDQQRQDQQPRRADQPQRTRPTSPAQSGADSGRGNYPVQQRTREQAAAWQQQRGWAQQGAWQEHNNWQQDRAQHWQSDHRTWGQRGGYGGYYIPEDRFRLSFGSQHAFRIQSRPIMIGGYPRFQYGDYWFMLVDPWPEYWSDDWYANDDVYVDYDNGYYLYNRRYPGVGIAISVVL